ncbi:hypothetical protein TRM7557_01737 [Tritonibacter multivorans]|uniref:Uncharacterized protein n=1 Tax=Tritonibacter multivorans TaxID=928856 RepID=A0A0P1GQY9_9RHOB|nr:hypothetical protein [Tritonibacter multivorans]MDA7422935.1 hypothetical protein [Tritonibacter multivorans]CUH78130.1 hypothetical protein TRM7557_01737 [Tritonibacter multivorans]SFD75112.1 hypothetical protein SAMN04488049_12610 [Tritonibacter multivorans]
MIGQSGNFNNDLTVPPMRSMRYDSPAQLYAAVPEVAAFTKHRPSVEEDNFYYFQRLKGSTTPEDAITFAAFSAEARSAIHWAMQAVRTTLPEPGPEDAELLIAIGQWMDYPGNETRWRALQLALFAPRRSPIVYIGLAVGWSGGIMAPNDPSRPPVWRTASAVNAALLTTLARGGAEQRSVNMARILDAATSLFRGR